MFVGHVVKDLHLGIKVFVGILIPDLILVVLKTLDINIQARPHSCILLVFREIFLLEIGDIVTVHVVFLDFGLLDSRVTIKPLDGRLVKLKANIGLE